MSVSLYAGCKSSDMWCSYAHRVSSVQDLMMICFEKQPPPPTPDSQTSTRTQPGHYANAKGSLMPVKFECKIPDICGSVPEAVPSEADKSAEGKGITSSSVFAQNCFSVKGAKQDPSRFIHTPTPLRLRGSRGRIRENGTKLA